MLDTLADDFFPEKAFRMGLETSQPKQEPAKNVEIPKKAHYKYGKQEDLIPHETTIERLEKAKREVFKNDSEKPSYFILLWHCGCRKSELYERRLDDVTITPSTLYVRFHKRKKGGDNVDKGVGYRFSRSLYGIEDVVTWLLPIIDRMKREKEEGLEKGKRTLKSVKPIITFKREVVNGTRKTVGHTEYVKDFWMFPNIDRNEAQTVVKAVWGEEYYPHFARENRISRMRTFAGVKAATGIRSSRAIEHYIGKDFIEAERERDEYEKSFPRSSEK
jgi:hypothetical protein